MLNSFLAGEGFQSFKMFKNCDMAGHVVRLKQGLKD